MVIVWNDPFYFDLSTAKDDEAVCIVNSTSLYPMTESADCVGIQPQISSGDMTNASEPVHVPMRDGTIIDEHAEYSVQFFPVFDSDHIFLQRNPRCGDYKKTTILSVISSTIQEFLTTSPGQGFHLINNAGYGSVICVGNVNGRWNRMQITFKSPHTMRSVRSRWSVHSASFILTVYCTIQWVKVLRRRNHMQ